LTDTSKPGTKTSKPVTKPVTLVVRRGALRRFDRLKEATREMPAEVVWDRREGRGSEPSVAGVTKPKKDRRKATPSTWELADFAVAERASSRARAVRSKKS
jgi:hypothetical protein